MNAYEVVELSDEERELLQRVYADLMSLARSEVPAVRAAARTAAAHIAQALNGQGIAFELYTKEWQE